MNSENIRIWRLPFLLLAVAALIGGLVTGLARLGFEVPLQASEHHGAIMVGGFLGTLIVLEKVIPLKRSVLYLFPLLSSASVALFFTGEPGAAFLLLITASAGLVIVFTLYFEKERNIVHVLSLAGSLCWLTGNIAAFAGSYPGALPWWMAFVLLIITSERLELTKFLPVTNRQKGILMLMLTLFVAGAIVPFHTYGRVICGTSMIGIAIWLLKFDLVGISVRQKELTRYMGVALVSGYVSLIISGVLMLSVASAGFGYDMVVHSYFLGFVFAMIFAHGPVILPGVLGLRLKPYGAGLYIPLFFLHFSWSLRIAADLVLVADARKLAGIITAVAVPLYFITLATLVVKEFLVQARHPKKLTEIRFRT